MLDHYLHNYFLNQIQEVYNSTDSKSKLILLCDQVRYFRKCQCNSCQEFWKPVVSAINKAATDCRADETPPEETRKPKTDSDLNEDQLQAYFFNNNTNNHD